MLNEKKKFKFLNVLLLLNKYLFIGKEVKKTNNDS